MIQRYVCVLYISQHPHSYSMFLRKCFFHRWNQNTPYAYFISQVNIGHQSISNYPHPLIFDSSYSPSYFSLIERLLFLCFQNGYSLDCAGVALFDAVRDDYHLDVLFGESLQNRGDLWCGGVELVQSRYCVIFVEDDQLRLFHFEEEGKVVEGRKYLGRFEAMGFRQKIQCQFHHSFDYIISNQLKVNC